MAPSPDISLIINLHREGRLCWPTLTSARQTVETAAQDGFVCELILVLDDSDAETLRIAREASDFARLEAVTVRDLGAARNFGVSVATGRFVAFLDGDDLCCRSWLRRAMAEASSIGQPAIIHPQLNLFFGRNYRRYYWTHPDMRHQDVSMSRLLVENLWTSPVFAAHEIFQEHPYTRNRIAEGFGFEDWVWNVSTAAAGLQHIVAADTIHFIRRKAQNSLVSLSSHNRVIPDFRGVLDVDALDPDALTRPLGRRIESP